MKARVLRGLLLAALVASVAVRFETNRAREAMALQWIKHLVLNMFGASPYIPVKLAIVLADPPNCRPVQAIDWRPVCERDRQAHAVNTARPAAGANTGS